MMYSNKVVSRLKNLLDTIGETPNEPLLYSIAKGCECVYDIFEWLSNEFFVDSASEYGLRKYADLVGVKTLDYDKIEKMLAKSSEKYRPRSYKYNYSKNYVKNGECICENYVTTISISSEQNSDDLKNMVRYLRDYLSPGVVAQFIGNYYNFDDFDSFSFNADEWEYLASASFNFLDSLGGLVYYE